MYGRVTRSGRSARERDRHGWGTGRKAVPIDISGWDNFGAHREVVTIIVFNRERTAGAVHVDQHGEDIRRGGVVVDI